MSFILGLRLSMVEPVSQCLWCQSQYLCVGWVAHCILVSTQSPGFRSWVFGTRGLALDNHYDPPIETAERGINVNWRRQPGPGADIIFTVPPTTT